MRFYKNVVCGFVLALLTVAPLRAATGFLYALANDTAGNRIYGFGVTEANGALSLLPGFPMATGGTGTASGALTTYHRMCLDKVNGRLFAINAGTRTVSVFDINPSTGALTAAPFSPISLPAGTWTSVSVHPAGTMIALTDIGTPQVTSYKITATTATLGTGAPYLVGTPAYQGAFSFDGAYYFVGGLTDNLMDSYATNDGVGSLGRLPGSPFTVSNTGGWHRGFSVDSTGRLFDGDDFGFTHVFTTPNGVPTPVTAAPFTSTARDTQFSLLHPNGFLVLSDANANTVRVFSISGAGAATVLTPVAGSPFTNSGIRAHSMAFNSDAKFLFVGNITNRNIVTYSMDPATGLIANNFVQPVDTLGTTGQISSIAYLPPTTDLSLSIVSAPATVVAGTGADNLIYTIKLTNVGPSDTSSAVVSIALTLPSGTIAGTPTVSIGTFSAATNRWTLPALAAGASGTLTVRITVGPATAAGTNVVSMNAAASDLQSRLINTSDDTLLLQSSVPYSITSVPVGVPNPALASQPINMTVASNSPAVTFTWDFGDGTTGSGPSVQHQYSTGGTYTVNVTATDGTTSVVMPFNIVIKGGGAGGIFIGEGNDSDGDGFSNSFEVANGTNAFDDASTPFNNKKLTPPSALPLMKPSIKLNFTQTTSDSIKFSGYVDIPANFSTLGKDFYVAVGSVVRAFILDDKGAARSGGDSVKITFKSRKGLTPAQPAKFMVTLTKGTFSSLLAANGLVNADTTELVNVPFNVYFNNALLQAKQQMAYRGKKDKSGTAN